jgi:YegS/Rv2252/BmrU family lipid kinase
LGTFQFVASFIEASFGETRGERKQTPCFLLDYRRALEIICGVRTCVIFNPAARGNKARRFRRQLDAIGSQCALKATTAPGDARRLAAEAVGESFDLIVAAGGDGTVNEVLNGLGDAPDGFEKTRLGVLPLGTVNVFARELALPLRIERAWEVLQRGRETRIDLPRVEFSANGIRQQRYFVQLAGAGFDARAIELVDWSHKKKIGPLAYLIAGWKALRERQPKITVRTGGQSVTGEFVLVGNGRFYGGPVSAFPQADLRDGFLDLCVLPRLNWWTLMRCAPGLLTNRKPPAGIAQSIQADRFDLAGEPRTAFELDGEWVGHLPATFFVERERLQVVVP